MNKPILIIGSGLAGMTLVRELRKRDKERRIVVITADDGSFYSKPNLSNAFAAGKTAESLVLTPAAKLEQDLDITLMTRTAVARIDAEARTVICPQGTLAYDRLVLATGASQIPAGLAGDGGREVISVNSLADYARFRERLEGKHRVAIVGAGLIGCEFANDLALGGFGVDVYDQAERPLHRLLPANASIRLQQALEGAGIRFHLGCRPEAVQKDGERYILIDKQGNARSYDLVLSAIGLRPNLGLAKTAGLATGLGIVTDRTLRTSDPFIYALGDCIETKGLFLPYVMPIMQGAKKLAATLCGLPESIAESIDYPAMPIIVKTPACPTVVCPPPGSPGHWEEESQADGWRSLFIDEASGTASGFVLQGACTRERLALGSRMPALLAPA